MRVLAVSSQVAYGPVGLTAAVPALQANGHEVLAVPTITLSNHPGHGKPAGFRTQAQDMKAIFGALDGLGALAKVDAALTGYFAASEQVEEVANVLARMKAARPDLFILVDPVIGDEAGLYVPQAVAEAIRDKLLPVASCITPNRFELAWLSGRDVTGEAEAESAAHALAIAEVLATSIPGGAGMLSTLLLTRSYSHAVRTAKLTQVPHGTGDMLSGLYLAERLAHDGPAALDAAMKTLAHAISISAGTPVLKVAAALHP